MKNMFAKYKDQERLVVTRNRVMPNGTTITTTWDVSAEEAEKITGLTYAKIVASAKAGDDSVLDKIMQTPGKRGQR